MRNNKITIVFDEKDATKFNEISKRTKWNDKFLITIALREYYNKFDIDWKKAVIGALEGGDK